MKITPLGAAGEVTGSCYHIVSSSAQILVDFGMFQGGRKSEERNNVPDEFSPASIDAVILTHAHLDHCGRLPLLAKAGFRGPIYATPASLDMAELILRDSAKVQSYDVKRKNRKRERAGKALIEPYYTAQDVETTLGLFRALEYETPTDIANGVNACVVEAGHMLGSTSIKLIIDDGGTTKSIIFSGDLGPSGLPILKDSVGFEKADLVFMESTYGDRNHRSLDATLDEFAAIVKDAVNNKGRMLVPSFAVGRTQQLLYHLAALFHDKEVEPFPVFVDSPMAIKATQIYGEHPELYDEEAKELWNSGKMVKDLSSVKATQTADQSRAINNVPGPCMVIAGAGMCNAGRILHHFRHGLWKPSTYVCIVGYQAHGSLGRLLVDGVPEVKIFGEKIKVAAQVHTLGGFSAHAGQLELLKWFAALAPSKPRLILTHGEDGPRKALAKEVENLHGIQAQLPEYGEVIEL